MLNRERVPLFDRRGVRLALIVGIGLYLFCICAAWIARKPSAPDPSLVVIGPEVVHPRTSFPVRVISVQHDPRARLASEIRGARIVAGGVERAVVLEEGVAGKPASAQVGPSPRSTGPFDLVLDVTNEAGQQREIVVPVGVFAPGLEEAPRPLGLAEELPPEVQLLVEILPEGGSLPLGAQGDVWLRVTDRTGAPVPGAALRWTAKGAEPPAGEAETGPAGLARIEVNARNLAVKLRVEAQRDGETGLLEESQDVLGRGVRILLEGVLQAKGEPPLSVRVVRNDPTEQAWCDLYFGEAWVRTWRLPPSKTGRGTLRFPVDLPQAGTYRLQCYEHFSEPGETADVAWLFKSEEPRVRAVSALLRVGGEEVGARTAAWRRSVPVIDEPGRAALLAGFRTRSLPVTTPALLASTRAADLEAVQAREDQVRARYFVLIALSFGLVILWAMYQAITAALENRQRMALAVADLGDLAAPVPPPTRLVKMRAAVTIAFLVLLLVLNVVAMLELFKYV